MANLYEGYAIRTRVLEARSNGETLASRSFKHLALKNKFNPARIMFRGSSLVRAQADSCGYQKSYFV